MKDDDSDKSADYRVLLKKLIVTQLVKFTSPFVCKSLPFWKPTRQGTLLWTRWAQFTLLRYTLLRFSTFSSEADIHSRCNETTGCLWKPKVQYRVSRNPPLSCAMGLSAAQESNWTCRITLHARDKNVQVLCLLEHWTCVWIPSRLNTTQRAPNYCCQWIFWLFE